MLACKRILTVFGPGQLMALETDRPSYRPTALYHASLSARPASWLPMPAWVLGYVLG